MIKKKNKQIKKTNKKTRTSDYFDTLYYMKTSS